VNNLSAKAREFVSLVLSSSDSVALTGAGISTESGIPDYRSPDTGLWEKMDQSVVSLEGFLRKPTQYYSFAVDLYSIRRAAKPNPAHYLLAGLEKRKLLKGVITQNIDGLHYDAGSSTVHELHGSLRQAVCLSCNLLYPMDDVMERVISGENPPLCTECRGILKPNAVFFGEMLPRVPWEMSLDLTSQTDLFLVLGSSLQVSPVSMLPDIALRAGAKLVIVNLTPTPYDTDATLIVRDKVGIFASIVLELLRLEASYDRS
jgi:NAD-dependent deacetylase